MNRFGLANSLVILSLSFIGCAAGPSSVATVGQPSANGGYCQQKIPAIGPAAPGPAVQAGDIIDYHGPCEGPSTADQIQAQKRFEQFRFGRDYMDEG